MAKPKYHKSRTLRRSISLVTHLLLCRSRPVEKTAKSEDIFTPNVGEHETVPDQIAPQGRLQERKNNVLRLHGDLDTSLAARVAAGQVGQKVRNIVPRVTVQASPQPLLIQEVGNQTNTPSEHEQTVEHTVLEIVLGFLGRERAAVAD